VRLSDVRLCGRRSSSFLLPFGRYKEVKLIIQECEVLFADQLTSTGEDSTLTEFTTTFDSSTSFSSKDALKPELKKPDEEKRSHKEPKDKGKEKEKTSKKSHERRKERAEGSTSTRSGTSSSDGECGRNVITAAQSDHGSPKVKSERAISPRELALQGDRPVEIESERWFEEIVGVDELAFRQVQRHCRSVSRVIRTNVESYVEPWQVLEGRARRHLHHHLCRWKIILRW